MSFWVEADADGDAARERPRKDENEERDDRKEAAGAYEGWRIFADSGGCGGGGGGGGGSGVGGGGGVDEVDEGEFACRS